MAEIIKINETTWRFEDGGVRFFLLEGTEKALMIDTGMNAPDALEQAKKVTKLPIELLNTHADRDHISGNDSFEKYYMNPNEAVNLETKASETKASEKIVPVATGDIIDLGGRPLEIIDIPGHTPGSIAVLDINYRILYSGDTVSDANIFMFGLTRDFDQYIQSLKFLKTYKDRFDEIYPSHGTLPVAPGQIDLLIEGATKVANKEVTGNPVDIFGNPVMLYKFDYAGFLMAE